LVRCSSPRLDYERAQPSRETRHCYLTLWTCHAAIAWSSQDIHADMSERFALSRELAWGYWKHPPLMTVNFGPRIAADKFVPTMTAAVARR
jgi:hypothetical protein